MQSIKILEHAYSIGLRFFDSGPLYGACQSHQILDDFSMKKKDIDVYSKFLSKIKNPLRDLSKIIFRRCGINAYQNFWDSRSLFIRASKFGFNNKDIENFIIKQKKIYPNINFVNWFIHSPSESMLKTIKKNSSNCSYGISTNLLDLEIINNSEIIQTDATSIFKYNLEKLKAKKILVNRIHTYAFSKGFSTIWVYNKLLNLDPRINIILGTRKRYILDQIYKEVILN